MNRALHYHRKGQMPTFAGSHAGKSGVAEKVGLLACISGHLAGHRPNELDSEETVDFSAPKSSVTKRRREGISDKPGGHNSVD